MNSQEIKDLLASDDCPFYGKEMAIWLHDQIVAKIKCDIQHLSEHSNPEQMRQSILYLPSLNKAE